MTPAEQYRADIATLGLSQLAAGRWLGVSPKTAQNYASKGPSGPAAVAVRLAVALMESRRSLTTWELEDACDELLDGVGCTPWSHDSWDKDGTDGASRDGVRDSVFRVAEYVSRVRHSDLTAAVGVGS